MKNFLFYLAGLAVAFLLPFTWQATLPAFRNVSLGLLLGGGAAWLIWRWRRRRPLQLPWFSLPLLAFVLWQALGLFKTPLPHYGFYWLLFGALVILVFLFAQDTARNGWPASVWVDSLLTIGLIFALIELNRLFRWEQTWWELSGDWRAQPPISLRLSGMFLGHPNLLAAYFNLLIPLAFVRILEGPGWLRRLLHALLFAIFLTVLFFSGSRAGYLAAAGGLAAMVGLFALRRLSFTPGQSTAEKIRAALHSRWVVGVGLALLAGLALAAALVAYQTLAFPHGTTQGRLDVWSYTARQIAASPWIGQGSGALWFLLALRGEALGVDDAIHAHNLALQITGETGLVGLALALLTLGLILRAGWGAWKASAQDSAASYAIIAFSGVAVGLLLHGLLDVMFLSLQFATLVMVNLALFAIRTPASEAYTLRPKPAALLLAGLLLFSLLGKLYYLRGSDLFLRGVAAAEAGDWQDGREAICQAARDVPGATFFLHQCALANAFLAVQNEDEQALAEAQAQARAALALDPFWYLHWANLASYEWQNGQQTQALDTIRQATRMAPNIAFLQANQGWMEERLGELPAARGSYHRAVCLNPRYGQTLFFQATELRRQARPLDCPPSYNPDFAFLDQSAAARAWGALQAGDLEVAQENFEQAIQVNPYDPSIYAGLGRVYQAQGRQAEAARSEQVALFIGPGDPLTLLNAAEIARQQGREEQAMQYIERAFDGYLPVRPARGFYMLAYRSVGLPVEVSPYLLTTFPTAQAEQAFRELARYKLEQGQAASAREILEWLAQHAPQ